MSYKQCHVFSEGHPPPKYFSVRVPCQVTLCANSVFDMEEEEKPDWSTVNAGLNRLKVVYYARQQKKLRDASANILFLDQLPKFEMVACARCEPRHQSSLVPFYFKS